MQSDDLERARRAWPLRGQQRPPFAKTPGPGQESVWDYPRPPVIVDDSRRIQVKVDDLLIADTQAAKRVLETASPPTFYLPPEALQCDCLRPEDGTSFCEWKGRADYFSLVTAGQTIQHAAWRYADPFEAFTPIRDHLAFYPDRVACYVDGERVRAQAGGFYGGWITHEIIGPFKGEAGTSTW